MLFGYGNEAYKKGSYDMKHTLSGSRALLSSLLMAASLASVCSLPVLAFAADSGAAVEQRLYQIPAGSLADTLNRYAVAAGVSLVFDPRDVPRQHSAGLNGEYGIEEGFNRLLQGTGLIARQTGVKQITLEKAGSGNVLPAVRVDAGAVDATSEGSTSYAAAATTIGKSAQSLRETPQSVSVLTRQRLDDQGIRTLDEALVNAPGITVEHNSTWERSFYSRGFEVETVQYDGVPTVRKSGFLASPDLAAYDRVEVLRGPAGLFNGAGQPGGTVNLVRKRTLEDNHFLIPVSAGSWNNYRVGVDINRVLNDGGDVRGRLVAAYEDREYFYDFGDTKQTVLYGIFEKDFGEKTTVGVGINYEERRMNQPFYGGLPRYSDGREIDFPRSTYFNAAWSWGDVETKTLFADINHRFNDDWTLKVSASRMYEDSKGMSGSAFGTYNPEGTDRPTLSAFDGPMEADQSGLDATLNGSFSAFGRKHDLLIGANYMEREYNSYSQLYSISNPVVEDPLAFDPRDYADLPTVIARAATNSLARVEQSGIYGSLRLSLTDPMKLIIGGRLSDWETSTRNLVTGAYSTEPYKDSAQFTPYAALTYDIQSWTVYGSYTEIFRSQANLFDINGERLDPMTGDNVELGLKGELLDSRLNTSIALFRTVQANRSQVVVDRPCEILDRLHGMSNVACYAAEGKVRSQGADAEISGQLVDSLQITAGYTYNDTRYLRDRAANGQPTANEGKALSTYTPRHIMRLWATWQLPDNLSAWNVGGGVNMQTTTYKTSGDYRIEQKSYAVWNARIGYRINSSMSLALNVNNIFDKHYYRTLGSLRGSNWYGEPRSAMLSFQASL